MTNFRQKFIIENRERKMHRKFHKKQKTVKCSKLGEKNCRRCERWLTLDMRCQKEN